MFSSSTAPFLRCLYKSTPFQSRQAFPRHIPPFRSAGFSSGRRGTRSYRYTRLQILRELWLTSPLFKRSVIASGVSFTGFAVYHVEQVPESGRWRLNWIQPATELEMGKRRFEQLMSIYGSQILPDSHPATRQVTRVLERLISLSGVVESGWEVRVINAPNEMNAFVLPGGKVFVFSGILPICEGDDGLAAVLGHEMAHNVAHHAAENMTRYSFIMPFAMIASFLMDVSDGIFLKLLDYAYDKPGSRAEEREADYIGLMMMAKSCYDPQAAVALWERMDELEKTKLPQFLSTHPSSRNRIANLTEWLPKANDVRNAGECSGLLQDAQQFKNIFRVGREVVW